MTVCFCQKTKDIYMIKYSYNQLDILEKQKNGMNKNKEPFKNNHRPECQELLK